MARPRHLIIPLAIRVMMIIAVVVVVVGVVTHGGVLSLRSGSGTARMCGLVVVIMDAGMAREFVGAGEALFAAWESAHEGLFAGVRAYVACLESSGVSISFRR